MKTFVGITGTTCVGKSEVAVKLAKMLNTEIISADSMQIYRSMDIGTAKISTKEMCGVTHHMLDVVEPNCVFSSFDYQLQASKIIDEMTSLPLVVGGTGFYFDSLLYPPEFGTADKLRRAELQQILKVQGLEALCEMLKQKDSAAYSAVDLKNPVRVLRAIEIAESGESRAAGKGKRQPKYNCELFVLQRNRQDLYKMIDSRVDAMIDAGLVEEVEALKNKYGRCDTSAFSAIGYKEIFDYLEGQTTLQSAIDLIKLNTRHYAKRQITYFKKMSGAQFVDVDGKSAQQIADFLYQNIANFDATISKNSVL